MSASQVTLPNEAPDPEDEPLSPALLLTTRCSEALGALLFVGELPWWRPLVWWILVTGTGLWRGWYLGGIRKQALPLAQRRWQYRWTLWLMMAFVGSSAYLLYVPGNLVMNVVLEVYLVSWATMATMRLASDYVRTTVTALLIMAPTALRFIFEGMQGNKLVMLLGLGGLMLTSAVILTSKKQARVHIEQFELRRRAERASDAIASMGLNKSRFFAAVSHDLRQPVHAIGLYLDPIIKLTHSSQDLQAQHAADGIRQCWRALDDLLSQVLDLTRMDSGLLEARLQSVELAPLVRDLVMQHSASAERAGIRLVALVQAGRYALVDELMLKRVLSNLLDNAIKFSPANKPVVIALRASQGGWHLQVRDAGIGIALDAQEKIFEEFVQLNNEERDRKRGLGLGLAISKRFAHIMGGDLSVRSALGRGTCMTLSMPKSAAPVPSFAPNRSQGISIAHAPGKIEHNLPPQDVLLVEDDELVSDAMFQLLSSWGQNVRHVNNAVDAALQAEFGQIAICDVRLPHGESGIDVALLMRKRGKKVLLITGETDPAVRSAAQTHNITLLIKPIYSTTLLKALQQL